MKSEWIKLTPAERIEILSARLKASKKVSTLEKYARGVRVRRVEEIERKRKLQAQMEEFRKGRT